MGRERGARIDSRSALRVTTSFRIGRKHIAPALSLSLWLLAQRYAPLDITLDVADRRVDLKRSAVGS